MLCTNTTAEVKYEGTIVWLNDSSSSCSLILTNFPPHSWLAIKSNSTVVCKDSQPCAFYFCVSEIQNRRSGGSTSSCDNEGPIRHHISSDDTNMTINVEMEGPSINSMMLTYIGEFIRYSLLITRW